MTKYYGGSCAKNNLYEGGINAKNSYMEEVIEMKKTIVSSIEFNICYPNIQKI